METPLKKEKLEEEGKVNENRGNTREGIHKGGRVKHASGATGARMSAPTESLCWPGYCLRCKTYESTDRVTVLGLVRKIPSE